MSEDKQASDYGTMPKSIPIYLMLNCVLALALFVIGFFIVFSSPDANEDEININKEIAIAKSRITKMERKAKTNEVASELNTKIRMLNKSITDDKEKIPEIELLK